MKLLGAVVLVSMFALTGCAHSKKSCYSTKSCEMKKCDKKSCDLKKKGNKKSCCS